VAAFVTTFTATGGYLKAGTSFLQRFQEGFSELLNDIYRNFIFNFLLKKAAQ